MLMPKSTGLYHRAIIQSDPMTLGFSTLDAAHEISSRFAMDAGCDITDLSCLRALNISTVSSLCGPPLLLSWLLFAECLGGSLSCVMRSLLFFC